jgi:hypothetical protein
MKSSVRNKAGYSPYELYSIHAALKFNLKIMYIVWEILSDVPYMGTINFVKSAV